MYSIIKKIINKFKSRKEFDAYWCFRNEYKKPELVRLSKIEYFTYEKHDPNAIYLVAGEYNEGKDDGLWWSGNNVLKVIGDYDRLRKGDYVLVENKNQEWKIDRIKAAGYPSLPDILESGYLPGINCWIIGKIDHKI